MTEEKVSGFRIQGSGPAEAASYPETCTLNPEPRFALSETEARRLVAAIEDARPSDVVAILKRQPWFKEIRSGIRTTRHLDPSGYAKLGS